MTLYPANWGEGVRVHLLLLTHTHTHTHTHIHKGNPDTAPLDVAPLSFTARDSQKTEIP